MIHLPTGAMSLAIEDFSRNGPIPFTWTRNHDAWVKRSGVLGSSWFGNFDGQIRIDHFENHWEWTKSNGAIYALEPLEYGQEEVIKSEKISYRKEGDSIVIYDYDNDLSYEYQACYGSGDIFLLSKVSRHIFSIEFRRGSDGF